MQVETYFLHCPDEETPLEETLSAIDILHKEGKFKYFGVSNFKPETVEEIHAIATKNNYVLPTVYQGNYNPVARTIESSLFPILRKLKMRFYAYSPLAGGFLVKSAASLKENTASNRWDKGNFIGQMYHKMYNKPQLLEALDEWAAIAEEAGTSKAVLAYRWVVYNSVLKVSNGDGCIVGATRLSQLEETLKGLEEGPLSESVVKKIDALWEKIKDVAPLDNYHSNK